MTVLFLADIPDQVRLLTLYGKLKMGFRNSSGEEVTFDVLDEPTPSGTSTAPTVELGGGVTNGGSIDAAQINAGTSRYLDLIYKAAPGATIDYTRILSGSVVFTVTVGGTPTTAGATTRVHTAKPTPVVLITTAFGTAVAAELVVDATTDAADHRISYSYRVDPDVLTPAGLTTVVVLKRSDLTSTSMTDAQLMEAAVRKLGITRFRYQFGTDVTGPPATFTPDNSDLALGVVHVVFGADQFKNQDLVTGPTTTTGAFNAPTDLSFTILGATASVTDPSSGGQIDVNAVNNRGWIDVSFTAPTGYALDLSSILDLGPEFTLGGPGLGTASLDPTKAPTCLDRDAQGTTTPFAAGACKVGSDGAWHFRFWTTGQFGTGAVTLTFLQAAWSFVATPAPSAITLTGQTIKVVGGTLPGTVTLAFPTPPSGFTLDAATVLDGLVFTDRDAADGIQIFKDADFLVTLDTTRAITQVGTTTSFVIPVVITRIGTSTATESTAVTAEVAGGSVSWTFTPTTGTRGGQVVTVADDGTTTVSTGGGTPAATSPAPVVVPRGAHSYLDVTFTPSAGHVIKMSSIDGDEIRLSGFGAAGVTLSGGSPTWVGGNTWRYTLNGAFRVGPVTVTFVAGSFDELTPSRGPPPYDVTQTFLVTGSTGDVVHTVPETSTTPETVVGVAGAALGLDLMNRLKYLEIRFKATAGHAIDPASINGDEIQLRDAAGNLVTLSTPVRVGLTDTYRYGFTATLAAGSYTVSFVAGSFTDDGGFLNLAEDERFALTIPKGGLTSPVKGQVIDAGDFNGRGWVDVYLTSFDGSAVNAATVTDDGAEITVTTTSGKTLTVDGKALLVDASTGRFRYFFTGHTDGYLQVAFLTGSWNNAAGLAWSSTTHASAATTERLTEVDPSDTTVTTVRDAILARTWLDVQLTPVAGTTVNLGSVLDDVTPSTPNEISLSGAGAQSLTYVGVMQGAGNTFRYLYSGTLTPGTVTVDFVAGTWSDSQGNANAASSESFRLITQGTSFFIELSGGIILAAAGLTDEPLMDLRARVQLEIDTARKLFTLTFDGQLSLIKLGTVGSTSGRFVLDTSGSVSPVPQFWGVATIETNFKKLEDYGIFLFAKGTLQINTTGQNKTETITLKGIGDGGTDVTRTYVLAPNSFSLELVGQLRIVSGGRDLVRMQGGFYISIEASRVPKFTLYATAELSFGVGDSQLTFGQATGLIIAEGDSGVAGMLTVSAGGGIGLPNVGNLFSASGTVSVMFNTTLTDKTFRIPDSFLPLLRPTDPRTITIYAAAPGLDGQRNPSAPAGGEIYVKATIQAQLSIGGVLNMNGFIGITAAVDPSGSAYFRVDGAVGTSVAFIGTLTGAINLAVYVGAKTGVVGRIQLTRSGTAIPGVILNGQFLLEINTFSSVQTIQTFKVNTKLVNGRTVFDGFARDGAGNLVVVSQTLSVVGGFSLQMAGQLIIGSTLTIEGNVSFRLELAGANPGVELIVNGTIALAPIGSLQLIDSGFRINAQGLVARVQIALDASAGFGAGVNLKLSGSAVVAINTTGVAQTFGGSSVAPGFLLRIDGTVEFLGFATASGFVEISIGSSGFQMLFNVDFSFAGTLRFHLGGGAGVYTEAGHSGIALALNVSVEAGGAGQVFEIKASGTFNLNTTNVTRIGIAANTFLLNVSGKISVLKVITFDASMTILVSGNKWQFEADARMDFFGIATLDGHVLIKSNGDFSISLHGGMTIGSSDFGLRGDFNFYVTSLHNDTTGTYRFDLGGSASVKVRAFGITLAGVGLSFHFGFDTAGINQDGRVEIVLEVGIHVDLFLFSIDETARFSIGWLQFPPPIHLAGGTTPAVWGSTEHDLVLNVGSRAGSRGIATTDTVENVIVRQVGGTASDATIEVVMFGRTQQFAHVSSVTGNFGAGRDNVVIDGSVLVPVFIYGEGDNDVISFAGQGAATLSGGSDTVPTSPSTDNDYISASGPGTITMSGGAGNDVLIHTGTGTATIHGNAGADALTGSSATDELYGDDDNDRLDGVAARFDGGAGNDLLYVTVPSGALPTIIGGDETSGTDVDSLFLTLGGGADTLDVASSAAKSLSLTLNGQPAKTATGLEKMFVDGRAGADRFTVQALTSTSGLSEITFDAGRTVTVNGTRTESYTINGVVFTREVPDTRTSFDNAADIVTIIGTSGDDSYLLTNTTRNCLGEDTTSETKCAVAKMTKIHRAGFDVFVGQTVRSEGDGVVVLAGDGNDILDARGLTTGDELKVTLKGQNGSDHLYGTPYDDALDGGLGSDFFTGGTGTDTFDDASAAGGGDIDTLVETNDLDMGLYDDLFVVGHVSGTDWQTGATVEDLKGLFEAAVLTGGDSGNTFLVGDDDGSVVLGATRRAVRSWHGDATLTTKAGNDLVRVALNGANGARVHVTDGGGTDRLEVWGTALRENVLVDTLDGRGRVRTRAANTTTADAGTDATDLVSIDHSGVELVEIRTLGGGDRIGVRAIDVEHRIFTGSGDDTVAVGSNAGVGATLVGWPNALGNVNAIAAKLTLDGGDGGSSAANGFDQLVVDDTGDTAGNTGSQTGSTITGLGMAVGITYTGFATLAVQLGSGGDTYTVDDSHTGSSRPTYLSTGDGARPRHHPVGPRPPRGRPRRRRRHRPDQLHQHRHRRQPQRHPVLDQADRRRRHRHALRRRHRHRLDGPDRPRDRPQRRGPGYDGRRVGRAGQPAAGGQRPQRRRPVASASPSVAGTTQLLDFDATRRHGPGRPAGALEAAKSLAAGALGGAVTVSKAGTSWIVSYQGLLAGAVGRALDITVNTETLNAGVRRRGDPDERRPHRLHRLRGHEHRAGRAATTC